MHKRQSLRIGLIQSTASPDREENLRRTARLVAQAARRGASIVCLQELFASRYFAQTEDPALRELAEPIPGPTSDFLATLAKKTQVTLVGGSIYEAASGGRRFNTTLVFDRQGATIGKYRKVHIPQDPKYFEQFYFEPGDLGFVQVRAGSSVIAPLICYDQWFPEPARVNALRGAEILFYPTAIGWFKELRRDEPFSAKRWETVMRGHASMNGVFVAAVNRTGREGDLQFWGGSFVADPFGEVIARAPAGKETVLMADLDLDLVRVSQEGWRFLKNRRPDAYKDLVR